MFDSFHGYLRAWAGAALDVFEQEPLSPESPVRKLNNVILTPHMVSHTQELMEAIPTTAVENVLRVLRSEPPLWVSNPEVMSSWRQRRESLRY